MSALAVQIREELEKGYERLGEPQYAFALGKNLLFFGETEEEQKGGKYLLSELTHREYSKKLNNYKTTFDRLKEFADDNGGYHII